MADEQHIKTEEARAGSTPGIVRYILGISTALIIVAFALIVLYGMPRQSGTNSGGTASPAGSAQPSSTR